VPAQANLLPAYASYAELEAACAVFCGQVNARPHRITRRAPAEMLIEEQARLHPVPAVPFTAALGVTRKVDALSHWSRSRAASTRCRTSWPGSRSGCGATASRW